VIVGGGFGGLQAALHLRADEFEMTLIDRRNFHFFQPLAYQVATGALGAGEVCYPLRTIFKRSAGVRVLMAEVTELHLAARELTIHTTSTEQRIAYDSLIVAGGSRYNYLGHPEWQRYAAELKTLEGALHIRAQILAAFEAAEVEGDPAMRQALLTFAVVGGGPTGVEMAGQIAEIARDTRRDFRAIDTSDARVLLVEALDRVLAGFPPTLSAHAARSLEGLGVTPLLGHAVTGIDEDGLVVRDHDGAEERIPARTTIWAAGVLAAEIAGQLAQAADGETDRAGRLIVESDLSLPGHPEVLALGDMVHIRDQDPLPGVAPVAMQQGRYAAKLLRDRADGLQTRAFHYRDKGTLATIGRGRAVALLPPGIRLSGFPAWLTWLLVHLWYLIGFQNRVLVLLRWATSFLTHGRGTRLITGEGNLPAPSDPRPSPRPSPRAREPASPIVSEDDR